MRLLVSLIVFSAGLFGQSSFYYLQTGVAAELVDTMANLDVQVLELTSMKKIDLAKYSDLQHKVASILEDAGGFCGQKIFVEHRYDSDAKTVESSLIQLTAHWMKLKNKYRKQTKTATAKRAAADFS